MKTYITSDLHFDHGNIIRYSPESRGHFTSISEMNGAIIDNLNSMVTENDTLVIVGDIGFCHPKDVCEYLKRINGKKMLVWGNHDKKLRTSSEFQQQRRLMGVIWEGDYLNLDHKFNGKNFKIFVSHFPFLTWDRQHHGSIQLHGHCHSPFSKRNTQGDQVRQMDIGVDGNFMKPHDLDDICSEMSRRPFSYHGHHDGSRD